MPIAIERIGDSADLLGEGPLWDPAEQALYWLDSRNGFVRRLDWAGQVRRGWDVGQKIGSLALRAGGGAVCALQHGFHFLDFASGDLVPIADPEAAEPRTRLNDGKCDRQGRFIAGSMAMVDRDRVRGAFYRLWPDGRVETLVDGITVANGPCFSPAGDTWYFADSPTRCIFAMDYDPDSGAIANRRVLADLGPWGGMPDGVTVDAEGNLWTALPTAGRIACLSPQGALLRSIEMPVSLPSSVTFGGPQLDILFVTSILDSGNRRAPEAEAGALWAVTGLDTRGLPEPRFAG